MRRQLWFIAAVLCATGTSAVAADTGYWEDPPPATYDHIDEIRLGDINVQPAIGAIDVVLRVRELGSYPWYVTQFPSGGSAINAYDPEPGICEPIAILDDRHTRIHQGILNVIQVDDAIRRVPRTVVYEDEVITAWQEWDGEDWDVKVQEGTGPGTAVPEVAANVDQTNPAVATKVIAFEENGKVIVADRFSFDRHLEVPGRFPDLSMDGDLVVELPGSRGIGWPRFQTEYRADDFKCESFHRPRVSPDGRDVIFRAVCGGRQVLMHGREGGTLQEVIEIPNIHDDHRLPHYDVGYTEAYPGNQTIVASVRDTRLSAVVQVLHIVQ